MTEKLTYEYNHLTKEEIVRPANEEELATFESAEKEKNKSDALKALEISKKASGRAKLLDLGLDEDEINSLIGKNPEPIDR